MTIGSPISNYLNTIQGIPKSEEPICRTLITLGNTTISNLPLSQTIFGFTFFACYSSLLEHILYHIVFIM